MSVSSTYMMTENIRHSGDIAAMQFAWISKSDMMLIKIKLMAIHMGGPDPLPWPVPCSGCPGFPSQNLLESPYPART